MANLGQSVYAVYCKPFKAYRCKISIYCLQVLNQFLDSLASNIFLFCDEQKRILDHMILLTPDQRPLRLRFQPRYDKLEQRWKRVNSKSQKYLDIDV
jgi:hypothetical protein